MIAQLSELFIEGGMAFMSILTLLFALLFLAAWKAPAWVRDIGIIALAFGILSIAVDYTQMFDYLQTYGDVEQSVLYGGYKVAFIPVMYSLVIFIVSRIIHICQTPRI